MKGDHVPHELTHPGAADDTDSPNPGVTDPSDDHVKVPAETQVGTTQQTWSLPLDNFVDGEVITFTGKFIGFGSSQRTEHVGHPDTPHVGRKSSGDGTRAQSCAACRWFETRLFRVTNDDRGLYLLFNVGETRVPGEEALYSSYWVRSPYEIIDQLTTIRTDVPSGTRQMFLRMPARRLLAQAAYHDTSMRDAYEGRLGQL